jgi:hypothetical protein
VKLGASPIIASAVSRMCKSGVTMFSSLAVVKSQASCRSARGTPAVSSFAKMSE